MEFLVGWLCGTLVCSVLGFWAWAHSLGTLAQTDYGDWTLLLIVYVCMHICVCMSVRVHV